MAGPDGNQGDRQGSQRTEEGTAQASSDSLNDRVRICCGIGFHFCRGRNDRTESYPTNDWHYPFIVAARCSLEGPCLGAAAWATRLARLPGGLVWLSYSPAY